MVPIVMQLIMHCATVEVWHITTTHVRYYQHAPRVALAHHRAIDGLHPVTHTCTAVKLYTHRLMLISVANKCRFYLFG